MYYSSFFLTYVYIIPKEEEKVNSAFDSLTAGRYRLLKTKSKGRRIFNTATPRREYKLNIRFQNRFKLC